MLSAQENDIGIVSYATQTHTGALSDLYIPTNKVFICTHLSEGMQTHLISASKVGNSQLFSCKADLGFFAEYGVGSNNYKICIIIFHFYSSKSK